APPPRGGGRGPPRTRRGDRRLGPGGPRHVAGVARPRPRGDHLTPRASPARSVCAPDAAEARMLSPSDVADQGPYGLRPVTRRWCRPRREIPAESSALCNGRIPRPAGSVLTGAWAPERRQGAGRTWGGVVDEVGTAGCSRRPSE